jgi:uncharacterized membrane protein
MSGHDVGIVVTALLASGVEFVEALTIVLAMGTTRGWRSALIGTGAAVAALAAVVAALGPALTRIPIDDLRLVVGALLLVFGLQWLRKAILRSAGYVPLHDEEAIFERERAEARAADSEHHAGLDWFGFVVSFKGVFLEGLEVAFIVLTFGTSHGNVALAALGAAIALAVVIVAGALLRRPLTRVPENALKFSVGVMLVTFGIFWSAEGAGVQWPSADLAIGAILAFMLVVSLAIVWLLRRGKPARVT